ncbi:MAG: hypothetical protein AAGB22_08790, partial [Bacteroidota bacterium]
VIGEPWDLATGPYTIHDLFTKLYDYNDHLDSITNTTFCADNPYFDWILNPSVDNSLNEQDRFFSMDLNNHLIGVLRLKEAVLNQEKWLIDHIMPIQLNKQDSASLSLNLSTSTPQTATSFKAFKF